AEDGIRDRNVTGVQTCALPIFGLAKGLQGLVSVMHERGLEPLTPQDDAKHLGEGEVIVDNQYTSLHHRCVRRRVSNPPRERGRGAYSALWDTSSGGGRSVPLLPHAGNRSRLLSLPPPATAGRVVSRVRCLMDRYRLSAGTVPGRASQEKPGDSARWQQKAYKRNEVRRSRSTCSTERKL